MLRVNARTWTTATLFAALLGSGCQLIVDFDRDRIVDDAGVVDGGVDAGEGDDGGADAGEGDAGEGDAGEGDAGEGDAGELDGGESDAGEGDAGALDGGESDAGSDAGPVMVCGDGVMEGTEACDDGDTTTETECPYGTASCTLCNATCTMELSLTGPVCGDAMTELGEETCDDGNTVTEACPYGMTCTTVCDATCDEITVVGPSCGDTIVNGPETCEPPGTATCDATCMTI